MTDEPDPAPPARERLGRPPRFLVVVAVAVVLAAAGWSAVWYAGTARADRMIADWLASEAAKGRTYRCGERTIGGYPFRVEATCASPSLDIADAAPRIRASAAGFRAVAQVWNLTHVIFEIDGPVRVEAGDRPGWSEVAFDADWQLLQGSLRAPGGRIARVDMVVDDLTATPGPPVAGAGGGVAVSARRVEAHGRHAEAGGARDYDLALDADGLVVAFDGMTMPQPVDLAFVGRLGALPYPPPRDPAAFLAAWRDNGGSVEVGKLSATQGDSEIRAEGRLVPDGAGRPEGTVTVRLAGPDIDTPGAAGAFGGIAPIVALALRLTGRPAEIDGRAALAGEIDLRDGQVFLGPVPLATLPALF